jgi:hypothetical protein
LRVAVSGWRGQPVRPAASFFGGFQYLEGAHERLVDGHHGRGVVKLAAVVWGRKEGDQPALGKELVAVLHDLVGPADQIEVVLVQKGRHNVLPKGKGDPPVVLAPPLNLLVGVAPDRVTQEARVGDVRGAHNVAELFQIRELRTQSPVDAKDFLVNECGTGEAIEGVRKDLPQLDRMPSFALVVKAVDTVDRGALVVPPDAEKILGILDLVGQDEHRAFDTLLPAVDVVSQKQVVCVRGEAPVFEDPEHVVELPVNIADDLDRGHELEEHRLGHQDFAGTHQHHFDLGRGKVDERSRLGPAGTVV